MKLLLAAFPHPLPLCLSEVLVTSKPSLQLDSLLISMDHLCAWLGVSGKNHIMVAAVLG